MFKLLAALTVTVLSSPGESGTSGSYHSRNFSITGASPAYCQAVAENCEAWRKQHALDWLGQELPPWIRPAQIRLNLTGSTGGGYTTHGYVQTTYGLQPDSEGVWEGDYTNILDDVVPHEVLHIVMADLFDQPTPRWFDEGIALFSESEASRKKQDEYLYEILTTGQGMAFNEMLNAKEYPTNIFGFYTQSVSLVHYLFLLNPDRKVLLQCVVDGMQSNWASAFKKHYGMNPSELQVNWLEWIRSNKHTNHRPRFLSGKFWRVNKQNQLVCADGSCQLVPYNYPQQNYDRPQSQPTRPAQPRPTPRPNPVPNVPVPETHGVPEPTLRPDPPNYQDPINNGNNGSSNGDRPSSPNGNGDRAESSNPRPTERPCNCEVTIQSLVTQIAVLQAKIESCCSSDPETPEPETPDLETPDPEAKEPTGLPRGLSKLDLLPLQSQLQALEVKLADLETRKFEVRQVKDGKIIKRVNVSPISGKGYLTLDFDELNEKK